MSVMHRPRWAASLGALALIATTIPTAGCKPGKNAAGQIAQTPGMEATGQSKCGVKQSSSKPLVVEWPSTERAALEGRTKAGLVAVRYNGCEMEVLTNCSAPKDSYNYVGLTQKTEVVRIADADELYAQMPVGAAKLEGQLERSGELNVEMTIVGRMEATTSQFIVEDLHGRCDDATHVITGLTVGAFSFYSGAAAEVGASATIGNAGGGAKSSSEKSLLNTDGDLQACATSTPDDASAPANCGAALRIEVVPIDRPVNAAAGGSESSSIFRPGIRDDGEPDPNAEYWTEQDEKKLKTWKLVAFGGGVAFLGGAALATTGYFLILRANSQLDDLRDGTTGLLPSPSSDREKAIRLGSTGNVLTITGLVVGGVGALAVTFGIPALSKLRAKKASSPNVAFQPTANGIGFKF